MKTKIKKDWFGRLKSGEELYNDSNLWLSEIEFINHEILFLNHLLSSNYIEFLEVGLSKKIDDLVKRITSEKKIGKTLRKHIKDHKKILFDLIETKSVTSNKNYLETHKKFDREIHVYLRQYKDLKKEIFEIVENRMKKKEQKILL